MKLLSCQPNRKTLQPLIGLLSPPKFTTRFLRAPVDEICGSWKIAYLCWERFGARSYYSAGLAVMVRVGKAVSRAWVSTLRPGRIAQSMVSPGNARVQLYGHKIGQQHVFILCCKRSIDTCTNRYNIPSFLSIPEKTSRATEVLLPSTDNSSNPNLAITFLSAASFPLAFPPTVARGFGWPRIGFGVEGVNLRVAEWLLSKLGGDGNTPEPGRSERSAGPRIRGWVMMDFFQDPQDNSVVPLLIECNFLGRVTGEEGWP